MSIEKMPELHFACIGEEKFILVDPEAGWFEIVSKDEIVPKLKEAVANGFQTFPMRNVTEKN